MTLPVSWRRALVLLALCTVPFAARTEPVGDAAGTAGATQREVLVMLRLPPLHFRPDAGYVGGYSTQSGSAARQRTAEDLAARFKLRIVSNWPMPALGVVCFVMEAPEDLPL